MTNIHGLKKEAKKLRTELNALIEHSDSTFYEIRQLQRKIDAINNKIRVMKWERQKKVKKKN